MMDTSAIEAAPWTTRLAKHCMPCSITGCWGVPTVNAKVGKMVICTLETGWSPRTRMLTRVFMVHMSKHMVMQSRTIPFCTSLFEQFRACFPCYQSAVWSGKCRVWSVECEVRSVECKVWSGECRVSSEANKGRGIEPNIFIQNKGGCNIATRHAWYVADHYTITAKTCCA